MNYHRLNFLFLSVRVNDYHRLNFLFLSVHVNAIWTLKSNFGAGSMNASFFFKDFNHQKINLSICLPQFHQLLWSKCRIIDPNSRKQAQQPLEKTTSRSLHILPAEVLQVRSNDVAHSEHEKLNRPFFVVSMTPSSLSTSGSDP